MTAMLLNRSGPDLLAKWQEQIGQQRGARQCRGARPFAALSFCYRGFADDELLDLRRLRIDVLHDVERGGGMVNPRFARYCAGLGADGVVLGGASRLQLEKNLNLTPGRKFHGRRIGAKDSKLLDAALCGDKYLERCSRFPHYPRRSGPRMPSVWVSLSLNHPTGSGVLFDRYCHDTGWPADLALSSVRRLHRSKWLYPIEFVLHHALRFRGVYFDMSSAPRRQVFRIERTEDLIGSEGICRFDFWSSCYRSGSF